MASTARGLQLGARWCCAARRRAALAQAAAATKTTKTTTTTMAMTTMAARPAAWTQRAEVVTVTTVALRPVARRGFTSTATRCANEDEEPASGSQSDDTELGASPYAGYLEKLADMSEDIQRELDQPPKNLRMLREGFWNEDEEDMDAITEEDDDDEGRDIMSLAHSKLDEHRDRRHYARLAVWELPLLAKYAKTFEPPTADMPLRFRYTTYMGEFHPAERKVVVEFCPADFDLTPIQQDKLRKLAGPRLNPEKDIVRMSCETYEHAAQNKRRLGDLVDQLLEAARDPTDTFEDIPLDTRHHTFRNKPKFPVEWRINEARRQELQDTRAQAFLLDQKKMIDGTLIDGLQITRRATQAALGAPIAPSGVADMVRVRTQHGR